MEETVARGRKDRDSRILPGLTDKNNLSHPFVTGTERIPVGTHS